MDSFLTKGSNFGAGPKWLPSKSKRGRALPQTAAESINRDTYGFQVPAQYVETYKKFSRIYQVEEEERSLRWETFLSTYEASQVPEAELLEANGIEESSSEESNEGGLIVDKNKRRGQGGDAKFKSNFRPELWLIERAIHAQILSGNGKAAQMDSLAGDGNRIDCLTEDSGEESTRPTRSSCSSGEQLSERLGETVPGESDVGEQQPGGWSKGSKARRNALWERLDEDAEALRSSEGSESASEAQQRESGDDDTDALELRMSEVGPRAFSWAAWAQELNSLVMGGVPMALRGEVWQIFVGTKARRRDGVYDSLLEDMHKEDDEDPNSSLADIYARLREKDAGNPWAIQIEKDLPRTFPGHPALDSMGRDSLRRLLTAYAKKVPEVGYCQGMNFLGGLLLLLMPEENAFWTLYGIIDDYLHGYYSDDMIEAQVDQLVFEELVRQNFPRLASHLEGMGVQISWVTGPWFLSVFVNVLPWESVLRVWDVMLYQRSRSMLFRTALALIEMHSVALLDCRDTGDIMANMQAMTGSTFDSSELVLRACVGYMDVDDGILEKLRENHRPAVMVRLAERKESLARYQDTKEQQKQKQMREQQQALGGTPGAQATLPLLPRAQDDLALQAAYANFQRELVSPEPTSEQHKSGLNFPRWVTLQPLPPRARLARSSSLSRLVPTRKVSLAKELSSPIRRLLFPKTRTTAITLLRSSSLIHRPLLHLQHQLWSAHLHPQYSNLVPTTPQPQPSVRSPLTHLLRHHSDASASLLASLTASPLMMGMDREFKLSANPHFLTSVFRKSTTLSSVSELPPSAAGAPTAVVPWQEPSQLSLGGSAAYGEPITPFAQRLAKATANQHHPSARPSLSSSKAPEQGATRPQPGSEGPASRGQVGGGTVAPREMLVAAPDAHLEEQLKRERATVAELREQVSWLKEQLVATLEAEQESSLRANELQIAMVEMAERDNSQSLAVKVEAMDSEIGVLRRELARQQQRSAEVLAGALAEKEKQAEEDLKQLLLVLAAKEDRLQMDVDALQAALDAKDAQTDRLMKEISRQQLAMKEKEDQLRSHEQQVQTQKRIVDVLAERNKALMREMAETKERAVSAEGMLKAYMQAAPAESTYSTFNDISPHSSPRNGVPTSTGARESPTKSRIQASSKASTPSGLVL